MKKTLNVHNNPIIILCTSYKVSDLTDNTQFSLSLHPIWNMNCVVLLYGLQPSILVLHKWRTEHKKKKRFIVTLHGINQTWIYDFSVFWWAVSHSKHFMPRQDSHFWAFLVLPPAVPSHPCTSNHCEVNKARETQTCNLVLLLLTLYLLVVVFLRWTNVFDSFIGQVILLPLSASPQVCFVCAETATTGGRWFQSKVVTTHPQGIHRTAQQLQLPPELDVLSHKAETHGNTVLIASAPQSS